MLLKRLKKIPLHTILPVILSVSIAIVTLLSVLTINDGVNASLKKIIDEYGGGTKRLVLKADNNWVLPTRQEYKNLAKIPDFKAVAGETRLSIAGLKGEKYRFRGLGVTSTYFQVKRMPLELGRGFTEEEVEDASNVMVIGYRIKEALFEDENPLGQKIRYFGVDYTVVGTLGEILANKRSLNEGNANETVFVPYTSALPTGNELSQIWIDTGVLSDEQTKEIIKNAKVFSPEVETEILSQEKIWSFVNVQKKRLLQLLFWISIIITCLAGLNIMMVALSQISQNIHVIGIKKAIGATDCHIFMELLERGICLYSLGGLIGLFIFYLFMYPIGRLFNEQLTLNINTVLFVISGVFLLGFLVSLYPASLGGRLTPVEAIYRRGAIVSVLKKDATSRAIVITGIAISVMAIMLISMIGGNFVKQVDELMKIFPEELIYIEKEIKISADFVQPPDITYDVYLQLKNELASSSDLTWSTCSDQEEVTVDGETYIIPVYEVEKNFFETLKLALFEGHLFSNDEQIILGYKVARYFAGKAGKSFRIRKNNYHVSGILADIPTEVGGLRRYDYGNYIFKQYSGNNQSAQNNNQIIIKVRNATDVRNVISQIKNFSKQFYPDKGSFPVIRPAEFNLEYKEKLLTLKKLSLIYAIIGLFVSGLGVMNLMTINVGIRIKEIGVRRVVGAKKTDILKMILIDSIKIACMGGIIGILGGIFISFLLASYFSIAFTLSPLHLLPAIFFSILVGILAGLYPAFHAIRMSPIRILKPSEE